MAPIEDISDGFQDAVPGNLMMQSLQDKLELQNAEMNQLKIKYKTVVFAFAVFVLGLVVRKIFLQ